MGYDLHVHSNYSDGSMTPGELIREAIRHKLDGIALTDHDTVDGLAEVLQEAKLMDYLVLPGIEFTTDFGSREVHVLGYNIDHNHPRLRLKCETILKARAERAHQIVIKLQKQQINLDWEDIRSSVSSRFIGRAHIFQALERAGYIDPTRRREGFQHYLGASGMAYVPHSEITALEAIDVIIDAGGVPVLAHPGRAVDATIIKYLVDHGLQGLEVYYPTHTSEMVAFYLELVRRYGLIVTGGSDFHGKFRMGEIGQNQVATLDERLCQKFARK